MEMEMKALALRRAGYDSAEKFAAKNGIRAAEIPVALAPYLAGYQLHRIRPGDTLTDIAGTYETTVTAIETANPDLAPCNLQVGRLLVVPLGFRVVPEDTPMTWQLMRWVIRGLKTRYPGLREAQIGRSVSGRSIPLLRVGRGQRAVYFNAAHHANEWITAPLVLACLERLLEAESTESTLLGANIAALLEQVTLYLTPMVNPDGVDLVTGAASVEERQAAEKIAADYPEIPFPTGWKANLRGVDLNLNYPARWEEARKIKESQGYVSPAPRDYVGAEPLSEPESRCMFESTERLNPELIIAWHTQGREIYWRFLDLEPEGAETLGRQMAAASGYRLAETPYASSFAGYKDWFIQDFRSPGYTIEAGEGENPLPLSQLPQMIEDNLPIFLLGMTGGLPAPKEGMVSYGSEIGVGNGAECQSAYFPTKSIIPVNSAAWG